MAWRFWRASSRFGNRCKRLPSSEYPCYPSVPGSSHGKLRKSPSTASKGGTESIPETTSYPICYDRVSADNSNSHQVLNASSNLAIGGVTTSQAEGCCPWICRGPGFANSKPGTLKFLSKSMRTFCSVSRSTSHHLDRLHELPPVLGNRTGEIVEPDILCTEDGQVLYSGMKSSELLSTLINLQLVAYEPLVDLSSKVLKSPLMKFFFYKQPLLAMVKRTAYSHFCAGENVKEASRTLQRMWELGLKSILDYSLEDAVDNNSCDSNLKGFLQTIVQSKQLPTGSVSFSCVKMTALCPLPLLEKISSLLRWKHMHAEFKLPWREDVLPLLVSESPMYHVRAPPEPLTAEEEHNLCLAKDRLWRLCGACEDAKLPLLVDAEYTSVQPAIDYYTYVAASEFNRHESPLVYSTIQAYLKDSLPRLSLAANEAGKRGMSFGVKLVRGAYITRESALAASLGVESPIHSCIEKTHDCYDRCAAFMMERVASTQGAVVLATHNFDSGRAAAVKAESLGLLKGKPHLQFAQLKGMADGLSLALVHAGFQVSKYLPFGPVEHVMPYLIRRAEENRGLLGNTSADRARIRQELRRRFLSHFQF
ncbi:hypothetical protein GOP47_0016820 [Adiantum capillus-veneris]|uniref:Proline dehydrogenase n=1 Tax=Adiantum capillus-veneris TaxID=13818 RepID=A0A9D4UII6_ADICA|nr:hypothetical protein GOP47_0016820 [Adiantum capillus-veneris]